MFSSVYTAVVFLSLHQIVISQSDHQYDAIIMGAGSSGISAAKTLYESGMTDILIIEAQDYIGGRAKVVEFANHSLNVGASWISGACVLWENCSEITSGTNPMFDAAIEHNISWISTQNHFDVTLDTDGDRISLSTLWAAYERYYGAAHCVDNLVASGSVDSFAVSYSSALSECGWKEPLSSIERTVQWYGFDFDGLSPKYSPAFWDLDGQSTFTEYGPDSLFITDSRGYQGIIERLASEFADRIVLSSPIETVLYEEEWIAVVLEDGTEYYADYGVVTFSIGVLQSDIVDFVPPLPSWKRQRIQSFHSISYTPILVKWPYDFWTEELGDSPHYLLLNDDRFGFFPWIYILDHAELFEGSLIWRFDVSLEIADIVQRQSLNDTVRMIVDLKLSHYFDDVPYPEDIFVADWNTNRFTLGSYSHWPIGFDLLDKEALKSPVSERLFFAGEALSDLDFGYVHSAWLSGQETANHILACSGNDDSAECPAVFEETTESVMISDDDESLLTEFVWIWIVVALLVGMCIQFVIERACSRSRKHVAQRDREGEADLARGDQPNDQQKEVESKAEQRGVRGRKSKAVRRSKAENPVPS